MLSYEYCISRFQQACCCYFSGLVHLPELYSSFVEEQYKFVFAIAIQYTNPFKYATDICILCLSSVACQ